MLFRSLRAVSYSNASDDPTRSSPTRTVTYSVTDNNSKNAANGLQTTIATNTITIAAVNDAPTLTLLSGTVDTTSEDNEVEVTFAELASKADEADVDGSVTGFSVAAVSSGTLKIGTSSASATAWNASTNALVTSGSNAYWTPPANGNGTLNAFTIKAKIGRAHV